MATTPVESIHAHLWPQDAPAPGTCSYALLDAARDERIYPAIMDAPNNEVCLHLGGKARDLARVGPYLVPLERGDDLSQWLFSSGWGRSWGIFTRSQADFLEVIRHFQSLVVVHDEDGNALYFRYYDPRVLRIYLPTCRSGELRTFFGPVDVYLMEGTDPSIALKVTHDDGTLSIETIELSER